MITQTGANFLSVLKDLINPSSTIETFSVYLITCIVNAVRFFYCYLKNLFRKGKGVTAGNNNSCQSLFLSSMAEAHPV